MFFSFVGISHADDLTLIVANLGNSEKEKNDLKMQQKLIDLWVSVAHNG